MSKQSLLWFLSSCAIVSLGQEGFFFGGLWAPLASACGIALFWRALFSSSWSPFWGSFVWCAVVQAVQLFWLATPTYMGGGIYLVYGALCVVFGALWGSIATYLKSPPFSLVQIGAASSLFVLLEMARTWILTGFLWNPLGLSLSSSCLSIQMASVVGVFGLSFWVFFTNLLPFWKGKNPKIAWGVCAIFPYVLGALALGCSKTQEHPPLRVAIVQTGWTPSKKERLSSVEQWKTIVTSLEGREGLDLVLLPESATSGELFRKRYPKKIVETLWQSSFGKEALFRLPKLSPSLVSNHYLAQALAFELKSHVMGGWDTKQGERRYNSALHFSPEDWDFHQYDKRVLVPIGEYVPLSFVPFLSQFVLEQFGVGDSFCSGGKEEVIPLAGHKVASSICVEELYGDLFARFRKKGATLFCNFTNDSWFPSSRLPLVHWEHARLRSVEQGVFSLRASTTGKSGVIDCFGREVYSLPLCETQLQVGEVLVRPTTRNTLYAIWGDIPILVISFAFLIWAGVRRKREPVVKLSA